ncbi:MAG TPA: VC0807 family protein [Acidimicrobiales bacterium]|nr:VC0807 family protein [Acidimicrobiales bacterium]
MPSADCRSHGAPPAAFSIHCDDTTVHMPRPREAVRHAIPIVAEGVVAPMALFYGALVLAGFRVALIAALCWSYLALARRVRRRERVSSLLLLGTVLLTARTAVAFATGSAFVYFIQPLATTVGASALLVVSAALRRPFTQRFAHDFCPIDATVLDQPIVHRFFVRISLVWAFALLANAGVVLWLLLTSSVGAFVLERTAVSWGLTTAAIVWSIVGFTRVMRRGGRAVEWGRSVVHPEPAVAPVGPVVAQASAPAS